MKKILMICMLAFFVCVGCTKQNQEHKEVPVIDTKDFGEVLDTNRKDNDISAWESFVKEKSQYTQATINITSYTTEGDPIISTLTKNENGYLLTNDFGEDGYQGQEDSLIVSKPFKYLHKMSGQEYSEAAKDFSIICFSENPALFDYWLLSDYPKLEMFNLRDISTYKTPTFIVDPYIIFVTKQK